MNDHERGERAPNSQCSVIVPVNGMASPEFSLGDAGPTVYFAHRVQSAQEERVFARQERDNARTDRDTAKKERDSAKQERDAVKHAFLQCTDPVVKNLLRQEWGSAQLEVDHSQIALNDAQTALRNAQTALDAQTKSFTRLAVVAANSSPSGSFHLQKVVSEEKRLDNGTRQSCGWHVAGCNY